MRREETIRGNPVLQTTHPPTMVEELWVQETLLSLTVVFVTMESKGATVAADTSVEGEGRIEIEGVWSGVDEVEFNGEDALGSGGTAAER